MSQKAILLCNLGSPDHPDEHSVRRYLNQFLMDPSVIQLPWLLRRLIVSLFVLPKRPKASAEAYRQIWTKEGSPLVVLSKKLKDAVQELAEPAVFMAMRYGNPSIENEVLKIAEIGSIKEILFIPMYPHYAESTVETSIIEVKRVIEKHRLNLKLTIKEPFYNQADYIDALVNSYTQSVKAIQNMDAQSTNQQSSDKQQKSPHLLFSYHGLPELHLTKIDPSQNHCLKKKDCCKTPSIAHKTCYRHQVMETTRLFVEKTGLKDSQYSVAFQSRLGRAKWLEPSTESTLQELAKNKIEDVIVICPAFVTDCLETLEEIEIRGEEVFQQAGGKSLKLIPCLNNHPDWVKLVASWCNQSSDTNQSVSSQSENI